MLNLHLTILGLILVLGTRLYAGPEAGVDLAQLNGWDIVLADDASASERYAAEEFQRLFAQASGIKLAIGGAGITTEGHLFIGPSPAMRASAVGFDVDDYGDEDLRIVVGDGNIAIAGGRPRGTLYGVYTFVEDYLGVRFLAPDHTHVPPVGESCVVGLLDRFYRPPLEFRWSYYGETNRHPAFAARVRCNGGNGRTVPTEARFGGKSGRILINHTFGALLPSQKHGKEHPEYYCMIDGRRHGEVTNDWFDNEPCLTNPDVLQLICGAVEQEIDKHPGQTTFSVSQNDNDKYCRCPDCAAIDVREGGPMGSLLSFVNAVADVTARTHPQVKIGTLSYWYSRKPPATIKPRTNVQIQLCSIEACMIHPINDPECKLNAAFCEDLRGWSRICQDISIWNYNTNFLNYLLPCPNLRIMEQNIRFFVAKQAKGVFMQGAGNALGAEFSDLRNYIMSRLLWNPQLSAARLLDEFLDLHYRRAAPPIRRFIHLVHDNAEAKEIHRNCFGEAEHYGIDEAVVQAGLAAFKEARSLADDDTVRARVDKASICAFRGAVEPVWTWIRQNRDHVELLVELVMLDEQVLDVAIAEQYRPYVRRLFELCDVHGVTHWSEGTRIAEARELFEKALGLRQGESF